MCCRKSALALLALLSCLSISLEAQKLNTRKADRLFESFAYIEAAEAYEKALSKAEDAQVRLRLAECYRLTSQFEKAEVQYAQAVGKPGVEAIYKFRYGQMLQANGKCEEAQFWFRQYQQLVPTDGRGRRFEQACQQIAASLEEDDRYHITGMSFNSRYSDFAPAFYGDGMVFVSSRPHRSSELHEWTGEPFLNFFFVHSGEQGWREPVLFGSRQLNSPQHEGPMSFSKDQRWVYFTRNQDIRDAPKESGNRTIRLQIMSSELRGDHWSRPRPLALNSPEWSDAYPTLSEDAETMIFSSTRPGGYGGSDLWLVRRFPNGSWSQPENLGPAINTEGEEVFPFIHSDSTLYFSSDGHASLGGLDIFEAKLNGLKYQEVKALGFPLNSRWDDFGLIWDENRIRGYFSSNRPGGSGGDDVYAFIHRYGLLKGIVIDAETEQPLSNVHLSLKDFPEGKNFHTDTDGLFQFELSRGSVVEIEAIKDAYRPTRISGAVPERAGEGYVEIRLNLDRVKLKLQTLNAETEEKLPFVEVVLSPVGSQPTLEKQSDQDASLEHSLSRGTEYEILATKKGFTDLNVRISEADLESTSELNMNLMLQPIREGVTVELKNIYYDYDQHFIREDAVADLIQLAEFMLRNPGVSIELSSHTDSRGSDSYNLELSDRRAQAAVAYLEKLGIAPDRMLAKGYGEEKLRNRCANSVQCSDEEHQFNRRTEFTITGVDVSLQSSDKSDIPVNTGLEAR